MPVSFDSNFPIRMIVGKGYVPQETGKRKRKRETDIERGKKERRESTRTEGPTDRLECGR